MSRDHLPSETVETLYGQIKEVIEEASNRVYRMANFAMV
jgi:hypothetical protein